MYRLFFSLGVLYAKMVRADVFMTKTTCSQELENIHSLLDINDNVIYIMADDEDDLVIKTKEMGFSVISIAPNHA